MTAAPTRRSRREARAARDRRPAGRIPRLPVLIVVAGLVAAATLVGSGPSPSRGSVSRPPGAAAELVDTERVSTPWYCAAGTSDPDGRADETLVITNVGEEDAEVVVTVEQGTDTDPARQVVDVASASQVRVPVSDVAATPDPGVVVEGFGGRIVVEHELRGAGDVALGPCATSASPTWYFAAGTTKAGRAQFLDLFNPYGEDASVDVTLYTDEGPKSDPSLTGLTVPRHSRVSAPIHEALSRQSIVAVAVEARVGRVVAEQTLAALGDGASGLSVVLGAPEPAESWTIPDGSVVAGRVSEAIVVLNPGDVTAEVELATILEDDVVEPQFTSVPGRSVVAFDVGAFAPEGRNTVLVRSDNDVPIVVDQRWVATGPAGRVGIASTSAVAEPADEWVYAFAAVGEDSGDRLVVYNPALPGEGDPVTVTATFVVDGERGSADELEGFVVEPGERVTRSVGGTSGRAKAGLVVEADGPVVTALTSFPDGFATRIGVPVS